MTLLENTQIYGRLGLMSFLFEASKHKIKRIMDNPTLIYIEGCPIHVKNGFRQQSALS